MRDDGGWLWRQDGEDRRYDRCGGSLSLGGNALAVFLRLRSKGACRFAGAGLCVRSRDSSLNGSEG
jgi:hypothetical protein